MKNNKKEKQYNAYHEYVCYESKDTIPKKWVELKNDDWKKCDYDKYPENLKELEIEIKHNGAISSSPIKCKNECSHKGCNFLKYKKIYKNEQNVNYEKCIFHCDKKDWYDENKENGNRDWQKSKEKIKDFWWNIRENKVKKNELNFSYYIFPETDNRDEEMKESRELFGKFKKWKKSEDGLKKIKKEDQEFFKSIYEKIKDKPYEERKKSLSGEENQKVNFLINNNIKFSDWANHYTTIIDLKLKPEEEEIFKNMNKESWQFEDGFEFSPFFGLLEPRVFTSGVDFNGAVFLGFMFNFNKIKFNSWVIFDNVIFNDFVYFGNSVFKGRVNFKNTAFKKSIGFYKNKFYGFFVLETKKILEKKINFDRNKFYSSFSVTLNSDIAINMYSNIFDKIEEKEIINENNNDIQEIINKKLSVIEVSNFKELDFKNNEIKDERKNIFWNGSFSKKSHIGMILNDKTIFENIDFQKVIMCSYAEIIKNCNFNNCNFLDDDGKMACDKENNDKNTLPVKTLNNKKDTHQAFLEYFKSKGDNMEASLFLKNILNIEEKIIKEIKSNNNKKDVLRKNIKMEFLYAKIKKGFDDLTLYSKAEEFYKKEFDKKLKIEKESGNNRKYLSWLQWYKWISDYNTNATKAFWWIVIVILISTIIYSLSDWNNLIITSPSWSNFGENLKFFEKSLTSTIPFLNSALEWKDESISIKFYHYFQVIISVILWSMLVLSLRRKFKR